MLWIILFLVSLAHGLLVAQKPIHKVSTKTHDAKLVSTMLYGFYSEAYNLRDNANQHYILNFGSIALQYTSDPYCVEKSNIRYFIKSFSLVHHEYPASPCSLNLNTRFAEVVEPSPSFHVSVHGTLNRLSSELLQKSETYIKDLPDFDFHFYDFTDLNYDLQCESGYHQLMQVIFQEKVLQVNLQVLVTVPEQCTFNKLNPEFLTVFEAAKAVVHIPLSGIFYCQSGKTASCKKTVANTKNPRLKLYE
ncbi:hypothetical protein METBIDRAFT_47901 [Metschnikowia bicuspidata var. bicuspidata NRRL YB-4993]|uniref:Uncharacterized protein n=1 Tax=Metschnikowia bicuspidata var. bicuspidata NRRL YB-4993 TaxID=869754 RepID=A0A1A0H241_9ASCO|nr:hypothetical protein METBIDRAFT_47901 [Metschnikowia bicuspidata var. bicuspidata NRRL YB-4993]OBA18023.1 hypothetical protein METBIDRAFT_47901 [Metschnikowia bicuspidata var. bicuspidata NRRL YB-4993]